MAGPTPTPMPDDYEFIEVKVARKIDIHLSLDDLISAVQQEANALADTKQQVDAQVADKLNQFTQLAHQLKDQVGQVGQSKPAGGGA